MKKAIVTGGAGFIGSHLAEELVRRGYYVTVLDDLSTGKMDNIEGLLSKKNIDFVRGSITINRLAKLIIELVGSKVKPIHQEPRPGDIRHSLVDASKARVFGYEPKYDLKVGLAETIRWYDGR